jgi:CheY-like chemotaxis protein
MLNAPFELHGKGLFVKTKSPYLLVVEDNPADSFWLKREIKKAELGMSVTFLADGQRALQFLSECDSLPSALFLDLHLPGESGLHVLRTIRLSPTLNKIIVFVLDGSRSPKKITECEQLGVAGFLDKPVTKHDLANVVLPRIRVDSLP